MGIAHFISVQHHTGCPCAWILLCFVSSLLIFSNITGVFNNSCFVVVHHQPIHIYFKTCSATESGYYFPILWLFYPPFYGKESKQVPYEQKRLDSSKLPKICSCIFLLQVRMRTLISWELLMKHLATEAGKPKNETNMGTKSTSISSTLLIMMIDSFNKNKVFFIYIRYH